MDKTVTALPADFSDEDAVIVLADWFQFGSEAKLIQPCVRSRMLLWCERGTGQLEVNGRSMNFAARDWVFLPWGRRIIYQADKTHPFSVGGIHLIPFHAPDVPVVFQVAHDANTDLANRPERQDAWLGPLEGLVRGYLQDADPLASLATYIVEKFQSEVPNEGFMRTLAHLLLRELGAALQRSHIEYRSTPNSLQRLLQYIEAHLDERLNTEDLALIAGQSPSSVYRLFDAYTGTSPGRFIASLRAKRAATLLRTTTFSIRAIAQQVGFSDQLHFSRFFKQRTGLSPRSYRQTYLFSRI